MNVGRGRIIVGPHDEAGAEAGLEGAGRARAAEYDERRARENAEWRTKPLTEAESRRAIRRGRGFAQVSALLRYAKARRAARDKAKGSGEPPRGVSETSS